MNDGLQLFRVSISGISQMQRDTSIPTSAVRKRSLQLINDAECTSANEQSLSFSILILLLLVRMRRLVQLGSLCCVIKSKENRKKHTSYPHIRVVVKYQLVSFRYPLSFIQSEPSDPIMAHEPCCSAFCSFSKDSTQRVCLQFQ